MTTAEELKLKYGPYGKSYFGSGGAYGRVRGINACVSERADNGFVEGPSAVRPVDASKAAVVYCVCGDDVGDDGREWIEAYTWHPIQQQWWYVGQPHRMRVKKMTKL